MEIKLKGREMPRDEKGDVEFLSLTPGRLTQPANDERVSVLEAFTEPEVVELVNRAIYHIEYQSGAHRKRSQRQRDAHKALLEEMKRQGKTPLKGE